MKESLEEQVMRDLRRSARWERVHAAFLTIVSVLVAVAWFAFYMVREDRIWSR